MLLVLLAAPAAHGRRSVHVEGSALFGYAGPESVQLQPQDDRELATLGELVEVSSGNTYCLRYAHTADLLGDQVVVYGGETRGNYSQLATTTQLITFDPRRMTWRQPALMPEVEPPARYYHATAVVVANGTDERLLLFGGFMQNDTALDDTWLLTPELDWIRVLGAAPPPRAGHTLVVTPDGAGVVLFGGLNTSKQLLNDVWYFDLTELRWHELRVPDAPAPRAFHLAFRHQDGIFILGGCLGVSSVYELTESINICVHRTSEFLQFYPAPLNRSGHFIEPDIGASRSNLLPLVWAKSVHFASLETTIVMGGQNDDGLVMSDVWLEYHQGQWSTHRLPSTAALVPDARRRSSEMEEIRKSEEEEEKNE